MAAREEQDIALARAVMEAPTEFAEGFDVKTVIGALFVGFVMMPGSIYLGLVAGQSMGPAAEWVTIILFTEVARRSFVILKRQEIYILLYIAGGLTSMMGGLALSGGPFAGLIWNQFLVQSPAAEGIANQIPHWVVPARDSPALAMRTFFHRDWAAPIALVLAGQVLSRLNWIGLSYTLFRLTSDTERLAFPLAPIAAQGATALAESAAKTETWRWRLFSIGAMSGLAFGVIYVGIPTLTGVMLIKPLYILPIPWIDFTQGTERLLPAAATGIGTSLAPLVTGMVLPYWVVVGGACAALGSLVINPALHRAGLLTTWRPGMDTISTVFANNLDFWISFGIGTGVAIGLLGMGKAVAHFARQRREGRGIFALGKPPVGRGDFSVAVALLLFVLGTIGYITLSRRLVPDFPLYFFIFYGFLWTPFDSYINARMVGLTGQYVGIPFVRESTFILSRYRGIAIWFAPIPLANYGGYTQRFRELELTGTRIRSIVKAELLMVPIVLLCSLLFWSLIWRLGPIPSDVYPYAQKFWNFTAMNQVLWMTATTENQGMFLQAIKAPVIFSGLGFALVAYFVFTALGWPAMAIYGLIGAIGQIPHDYIVMLAGALLGRYCLSKRFGKEEWTRWTPVLAAGFSCGMGLIGMCAIAIALISKSVAQLPF
jgi:hypothetical protein